MAKIQKIKLPPEAVAALKKETGVITLNGPTHPQITRVCRMIVAEQARLFGLLPYSRRRALMMYGSHLTVAIAQAGPRPRRWKR